LWSGVIVLEYSDCFFETSGSKTICCMENGTDQVEMI
jgi:hypothetical protein